MSQPRFLLDLCYDETHETKSKEINRDAGVNVVTRLAARQGPAK
jgi:hypothetical protein